LDRLKGHDLVEANSFEIDIPTTEKKHHQKKCTIWFYTKEAAERAKKRGKFVKHPGKTSEKNLPFVRYLLNYYPWPEDIQLLDNDPVDPEDLTDAVLTKSKSITLPQIPPQRTVGCKWNRF
jgi:hypothetical protein